MAAPIMLIQNVVFARGIRPVYGFQFNPLRDFGGSRA